MLKAQERAAAVLRAAQPLETPRDLRIFGIDGVLAEMLWRALGLGSGGGGSAPSLRIAQVVTRASEAQLLVFLYEAAAAPDGGGLTREGMRLLIDAHGLALSLVRGAQPISARTNVAGCDGSSAAAGTTWPVLEGSAPS